MIKKKIIVNILFGFSLSFLSFQQLFFIGVANLSKNINQKKFTDAGKLIGSNIGAIMEGPSENDSVGMALAKTVVDSQLTEKLGVGTSDLRALQDLLPVASFFQSFPVAVISSQDTWDYKNDEVIIKNENKNQTTNEIESTIMLRCALQFKDHGDILAPIGFKVLNGKFYFNPGINTLEIKKINSGKTEVKNLLSASLKNSLIKAASVLKTSNLVSSMNLDKTSSGINAFFSRAATLYPQDIFILKIIQLINTANKNSLAGSSYPRIAHIPLELMLLFKRLSITPNYELTMKNNGPSAKAAYQWDPTKIIYLQDPVQAFQNSLVNVNNTILNAIKQSIQLNISSDEWNLYGQETLTPESINQDLKNNINALWNAKTYNERSDIIINSFIDNNNFVAFSKEEQELFINNIAFHVAQRYSGLIAFSILLNNLAKTKSSSSSDIDGPTISNVDLNIILKAINTRIPKVKQIIDKIKILLNSVSSSSNQFLNEAENYFNNQADILDKEISTLQSKIENLLVIQEKIIDPQTSDQLVVDLTKELSVSLQDFIKYILEQENANFFLATQVESEQIGLSIDKYLNCKFNQMKHISLIKFRGDDGFMSNPLPLNDRESMEQSMAILMRAIELMQKADNLFKNDSQTYKMYDLVGNLVDIKGPDLYARTVTLNRKMNLAVEKKEYELKNQSISSGESIQDSALDEAIKQVEVAQNNLNTEYVHYLRQYNFDTRNQNAAASALAKLGNTDLQKKVSDVLKNNVATQIDTDRKDLEAFIKANFLWGSDCKFKIAKKVVVNYLSSMKKIFTTSEIQITKQGELTATNKILADQNNSLANLKTSLNTLAGDSASKIDLQKKIDDLSLVAASLAKKVVRLNLQLKNLTQIPVWVDQLIDKVNKQKLSSSLQPIFSGDFALNPEPMVIAFLQTFSIGLDNINALKNASADYFANSNKGYENVFTTLKEINNNNPALVDEATVDQKPTFTSDQVTNFLATINQNIEVDLKYSKILPLISSLEKISNDSVFVKITALPQGINSSQDEINKTINSTTASESLSTTSQNVATTKPDLKTEALKSIFKSASSDYASNINSFLAENLIDLAQRSTLSSCLSLILDPVLISTFGCNMTTIMSQVNEKQKTALQNELAALLQETTDNGTVLIKLPLDTLQKTLTLDSLSEMSQIISSNSDQALDIFSVQASALPAGSVGTVSVGSSSSTITQEDGKAIDQTTSLQININTSVAPEQVT